MQKLVGKFNRILNGLQSKNMSIIVIGTQVQDKDNSFKCFKIGHNIFDVPSKNKPWGIYLKFTSLETAIPFYFIDTPRSKLARNVSIKIK